jgi:hypothetical protein
MVQTPEQDEIVPLISDIIAMGMTAELKALQPRFFLISESMLDALLKESAFCGKLGIFRCLWEQCVLRNHGVEPQVYVRLYACESIEGKNIEVLEYLAPKIDMTETKHSNHSERNYSEHRDYLSTYMQLSASSDPSRIFNIWMKQAREWNSDWLTKEWLVGCFTEPAIQERFADLLEAEASRSRFSPSQLSVALRNIAVTTCAPSIARVLLKHGAAVDYRTKNIRGRQCIRTPLLAAASKNTKDAAELMKLLLLAGADPNASYDPKNRNEPKFVGMAIGARQISKWLQMSWSELVEWTAAERSKNLEADGTRPVDS